MLGRVLCLGSGLFFSGLGSFRVGCFSGGYDLHSPRTSIHRIVFVLV